MFKNRNIRILAIFAVVLVLASATYAFAAANTVPVSKAGDGSNSISGYTVSAVHYALNSTNPTQIDSVAFSLDSAPVSGSTIRIKLVSSGSTWYSCTYTGSAVTCTTTGANVAGSDTLEVVVAQ